MNLSALVSFGGTSEPLDDVRTVSNVSTGRFGAAIARALHDRGVAVTVVGSERALCERLPPDVRRFAFRGHADLAATLAAQPPHDLVLMAAAVSDYAPERTSGKIRSDAPAIDVHLERVPKILPSLRATFPKATIVGFKLLSGSSVETLIEAARRQRAEAGVDRVVANDLAELRDGQHPAWLVGDGVERLEGPREDVAAALVDRLLALRPLPEPPFPAVAGPVRGRWRRWLRLAAAWLPPGTPGDLPEEHLAGRAEVPWRPVALRAGRGALLGLGEVDAAGLALGWSRAVEAVADLGGSPIPVVHDGRVVAAALVHDGQVALASTGLGDDDVWPMRVLPGLPSRLWLAPEAEAHAWSDRGFAVVSRRPGRVVLRAPWDREDVIAAASACLYDRPTGRVLVGVRPRPPAAGGVAFPGGRVEPGEGALDAARRELREETGLDAPAGAPWLVAHSWRGRAPTWHVTTGVWPVAAAEPASPTDELRAAWRPLDEVLLDAATLPGVRAVLASLRAREEAGWPPG